ncbi:hypothetical protein F4677DRAFT_88606 [Hypoxylon crocopeplum]|nr:hypothetical protein F4677DRAFT_88606 [Hypoxylon crocopeplum]
MSSHGQQAKGSYTTSEVMHALLRPAIMQILRAQGYHTSTRDAVDTITELAGNYMTGIARSTALYATLNNETGFPGLPSIVDVRLALEDNGALEPQRVFESQQVTNKEDTRSVDEFINWAKGHRNRRIRKVAGVDRPAAGDGDVGMEGGEEQRETDYLSSLKRKHNKTDQDAKYAGTILGRGTFDSEVVIEGGEENSIQAWKRRRHEAVQRPAEPRVTAADEESRPPSSGLSSLDEEDMAMIDREFGTPPDTVAGVEKVRV